MNCRHPDQRPGAGRNGGPARPERATPAPARSPHHPPSGNGRPATLGLFLPLLLFPPLPACRQAPERERAPEDPPELWAPLAPLGRARRPAKRPRAERPAESARRAPRTPERRRETSRPLPPPTPPPEERDEADWGEEEGDWGEEEGRARWFLYKELVLSGFYSPDGIAGVPPDDRTPDHVEFSPRPPGNYLGVDLVATFDDTSYLNETLLGDWMPVSAIDLHPRLVWDRMQESDDTDQVKFAPQDFWVRFNPGRIDRLTLRLGQFVIPYGVNPILAPRQRFILPLEATDLGLKWDWGADLKGPAGDYEWELAATIGSGEALHSPHLFQGSDRTSYLLTGRVGAPTYWDLQYGLSFLLGDLPVIRGPAALSPVSISRWRTGLDVFYKYGTYLMVGAQGTFGQDGFAGDEDLLAATMGRTAETAGYRAWIDWVIPQHQDLRLSGQFESVVRDLSRSTSDDTAAIFEVSYSLTTSVTLMLDYRLELNRSMGGESDALYFTFIYYSR